MDDFIGCWLEDLEMSAMTKDLLVMLMPVTALEPPDHESG
jgi:hypothetical protein